MQNRIYLILSLLLAGLSTPLLAQTITTQPLATSTVCAGSTLNVSFTTSGAFGGNNAFTVQLAYNANEPFVDMPTGAATLSGTTYTATVTLPATLVYGPAYRVRVVSSSPTTQGTASTTPLAVIGAPALPLQPVGINSYQYTFCQNDRAIQLSEVTGPVPTNYQVQYDFGTNVNPTGQRTTTPPTVNTNAPGIAAYNLRFVLRSGSQGCTPATNAVAFLQTEVKLRPDAPFVPNTALTLCQNSPAQPLSANTTVPNAELVWYDAADKPIPGNNAPTPTTGQTGSQVYQVAQSLNQCESPKTRITVGVQSTPAPAVAQSRIEVCKDATAPALVATGTNLRWTLPNTFTTAAAPSPITAEVTKNIDGDSYSVTQTGANGCVSPSTTIRVFVLGPPTLALSGSTTVTVGQPTSISLTFTGNGPYQFRLSNGLSGTAQKDTIIRVTPTATTVYQVAEVKNQCGTGLPTSSVTITVAVPTVRTLPLSNSVVCAGSALTAGFQTTGGFNTGNAFRLRITRVESGTIGAGSAELLNQTAGNGQVTGTLPGTLVAGTYWVAVVSSNPDVLATNTFTPTQISVRAPASATLSATPNPAFAGDLVRISVTLGGEGPWAFTYRDSTDVLGAAQTVNTNANPHIIEARPQRTATYRLTSLSNGCGNAPALPAPLLITVAPLLAIEPLGNVAVYPVPATSALTVEFTGALATPAMLELVDASGRAAHQQRTNQTKTTVPLQGQPAGTYLLRVRMGDQTTTRRILIE